MEKKEFEKMLAKEIKNARLCRGISQTTMRIDTGINIGRIETGLYSIELKTYLRICSYLNIDHNEILTLLIENTIFQEHSQFLE